MANEIRSSDDLPEVDYSKSFGEVAPQSAEEFLASPNHGSATNLNGKRIKGSLPEEDECHGGDTGCGGSPCVCKPINPRG